MRQHTKSFLLNNSSVLFFIGSFVPIMWFAAFVSGFPLIALLSIPWLIGWGMVLYSSWSDYIYRLLEVTGLPQSQRGFKVKYKKRG